MDWTKAKNILIMAFIFTNLLLLYVIVENNNTSDLHLTINEDFIRDVKNRLSEKGINVDCNIPKELPSMPLLYIEYEIYSNHERIASWFFNDYTKEEIDGITYYVKDNERLSIIDDREIIYENMSSNKIYDNLDEEMLQKIVNNFLQQKGFLMGDFKLNEYRIENGVHYLQYAKTYNNMFVEISYMKFMIDKTGVKKFHRKWIKSVEPIETKISVRSAPDSLLRLLLMEKHYGKTIDDIRLCYYFNPQNQSQGDWKNIIKGKAYPAWRVHFKDGTEEFLEEY